MFIKMFSPQMLLDDAGFVSGGFADNGGEGDADVVDVSEDVFTDNDFGDFLDDSDGDDNQDMEPGATASNTVKTFTQEEVDRIIGERLARERRKYDEVAGILESLQARGIDPSKIMQQEQESQLESIADELGITTEAAAYIKRLEAKISELENQDIQRQIDAEMRMLSQKYPDFEQHKQAILQTAIQKGVSLEDAYILATFHQKMEGAKISGEQAALAQVAARNNKRVFSTSEGGNKAKVNIATMPSEKFAELKERVLRGERIVFNS